MVVKVREYFEAGRPIPWARIYKVSDHVSFPHFRHVAAGVTCQTCHGEVQEMGVLTEMDPAAGDLKMGWCGFLSRRERGLPRLYGMSLLAAREMRARRAAVSAPRVAVPRVAVPRGDRMSAPGAVRS